MLESSYFAYKEYDTSKLSGKLSIPKTNVHKIIAKSILAPGGGRRADGENHLVCKQKCQK